ncbi:MAG TPA: SdrD B-like domain-containing protein [Herpetosiphonaceae bacterium]
MPHASRWFHHPLWYALCIIVIAALLASGLVTPSQAQIDNSQPSLAYASTVDCLRAGADRGQASHLSPRFASTCFGSRWSPGGYTDQSVSNQGDALPSDPALVEFGDGTPDAPGEPGHLSLASLGEVGAVYGVASSSGTNPTAPAGGARQPRLFVGAFTKRITRYGSGGPGAIYVLNRATATTSLYVQVPDVVPGPDRLPGDPGDGTSATFPNGLPYTPQNGGLHTPFEDSLVLPYVSKTGLGDVELDADERYLYAVNLNTRRISRFDTWSASPQASMTILAQVPNPGICGSGAADFRPFSLALTPQSLYLGYVCSAESTQNRQHLSAGAWRYDLTAGSWAATPAVAFNLRDYDAQRGSFVGLPLAWLPWDTNFASVHPLPLLAGISFDEQGGMLLGLRDRYGDLGASYLIPSEQGRGFGDLLRAAPAGFGQWSAPTTGAELYGDDDPATHNERTWGSIAYIPGQHDGSYGGEVITTFLTPYQLNGAGAAWYDVTGGQPTAREELYNATNDTAFAKSAGLGDVELLCPWRAIGDRVWLDANSNGVQDAGESDIQGVRVQLFAASDTGFTTPLATVTTGSVSGMSGNWRMYVDPWRAYVVRIDPAMFQPGQPLAGLTVTRQDAGGNDSFDSDATPSGVVAILPAGSTDLNVSYDIGVVQPANVRIAKSGPATVIAGSSLSYQLAYRNNGPAAAASAQVQDTLPAGVTFVSATPAPSSVSGQVLTWNLGTLAVGQQGTITVNTTVSTSAPTTLTNTATISTSTVETSTSDNSSSATTEVQWADVAILKTAATEARAGEVFTATLTYRNSGTATATNVQLVDTLPSGVLFVGATPAPSSISGQVLTWDLASLAPGASGTIALTLRTPPDTANDTLVTNTATISTDTTDTTDGNNSSEATTRIVAEADVQIAKTGPATVRSGSQVSYTLSWRNAGPSIAAAAVVTDTLPVGFVFASATPAPTSQSGQVLTWVLGDLQVDASGTIVVRGTLTGSGTRTNTATIGTPTDDPNPGDNTSTVDTDVQAPDLAITKTDNGMTAELGKPITYTLTYRNSGTSAATGVVVTETVPTYTTFDAQASTSGWSCPQGAPAGTRCTFSIPSVQAGGSGTLHFVVRVLDSLPPGSVVTAIDNLVRIADDGSAGGDPTPGNNSSSERTPFDPTGITLEHFSATHTSAGVILQWTTSSELNTWAFHVYRSTGTDRPQAEQVTKAAIPARGSRTSGATYTWTDTSAEAGQRYRYWLQELEVGGGTAHEYGPMVPFYRVYLPVVR